MAQNVSVDLQGKHPNEIAEADQELMMIWGQINNAWDEIERLLYVAFDAMLPNEPHFATQAIFYSQTSHAARRSMVEVLAEYALLHRPVTKSKLAKAIKRVKARSDDRNRLTHGTWVMGIDLAKGEAGLSRMAMSPSLFPDSRNVYSRSELCEVRDAMRDTVKAFQDAIVPIEEEKRGNALELMKRHMAKATCVETMP